MGVRIHRRKIRPGLCGADDVLIAAHDRGRAAARRRHRAHPAKMAGPRRHIPQRRDRHPGARLLSRRRVRCDRERAVRRPDRAGGQPAAGADVDTGQSLARRTGVAAAMARPVARRRRRLPDRAREDGDRRDDTVGLVVRHCGTVRHHRGHAVPEAVRRRHRLAAGLKRAVRKRRSLVHVGGVGLRDARGTLDAAVPVRARLARSRAVVRRHMAALFPDPPRRGDPRRQPVLLDPTGDRADGVAPVRRAPCAVGALRHGDLRRRRVFGQLAPRWCEGLSSVNVASWRGPAWERGPA